MKLTHCKTKNKNKKNVKTERSGCHCKGVNYLTRHKHNKVFIEKTTETLFKRVLQQKYRILNRSSNNQLVEHFSKEYGFARSFEITILDKGIISS